MVNYMVNTKIGMKMVNSGNNVIIKMVKAGECKKWHLNGQLKERCNYIDGKIYGEYKKWYDNGKKDGKYKEWYENGQLETQHNYKNGQLCEE